MPPVLYSADVVCPMTGPPVADAGVLVDGARIVAVDRAAALRADAVRAHHIRGVLLPGLVNARTRFEHADAEVLARPGPAHAWRAALEGLTGPWDEQRWSRSAHRGVLQALRGGASAAGDVVTRGPAVPAAAKAHVAGDSWIEVAGVDVTHQDAVLGQLRGALGLPAGNRRVGLSPVPPLLGTGVLQALAALAREREVPVHVAAAETQAEVVALGSGQGPLAEAARRKGLELEWLEGTGLSPIAYLDACGVLECATTVAHGVWVDQRDVELLRERGVTVVCCPRANDLLRSGEIPLERYAEADVPLALGTEGGGICPDQDLLAEARAWAALARSRGVPGWPGPAGPVPVEEQALRLLTIDGARAMGWGDEAGLLAPGRRADLVAVDVATTPADVYRDLLQAGPGAVVLSVVGGVRKARRGGRSAWPRIDRDQWQMA